LLIDNDDDYVINNNIDYDDSSNIDNNYDYSNDVSLVIKRDKYGDIYELVYGMTDPFLEAKYDI
jgi:hypothetical protein